VSRPPSDSRARLAAGTLALAALAFAAVALITRRGMPFNADGWIYWQGSVSILEGLGYRDFTGRPITAWPPLYPAVLALVQSVLGVSARSVALATALLVAAAVASWSLLLGWFARETGRAPRDVLLALALLAVLLALNARVRSEQLFHALLPLLLLCALRARASRSPGGFLLASSLAGAALLAALLTRNASLAFWPATLAVLLQSSRHSWKLRAAGCALVTALSLPVWLAALAGLGQLEERTVQLGGHHGFAAYLAHFVAGIDRNTGPQFVGIWLLVLLTAALLRGDGPARLGRAALLFTAVAAASLLALFNLTWVADKPEGRFTLFVTLILAGLGMLGLPALLPRAWLMLALVLLFAQPTLRLAKHTILGRGPAVADFSTHSLRGFAPSATTIAPGLEIREPEPRGGLVQVRPPYPRWARLPD
jgi:hypothetical protein